jgi:hypothetical protein
VTYELSKNTPVVNTTFTVTLEGRATTETAGLTNSQTTAINTGVALGADGANATAVAEFDGTDTFTTTDDTKSCTETASIDITALLSQDVGVYRYKMSEAVTSQSGTISADDTVYQLDFYVTKDSNGNKEVSALVAKKITTAEDGSETLSAKLSEIGFSSGHVGYTLVIGSHVYGNFMNTDQLFDYYINIPVEGAGELGGGITLNAGDKISGYTTTFDEQGNTVTTNIQVVVSEGTKDGVYTLGDINILNADGTLKETVQKIQLKHNETITLTDLPENMIFHVGQAVDANYTTNSGYEFKSASGTVIATDWKDDDRTGEYVVEWESATTSSGKVIGNGVQIKTDTNRIDFWNCRDIVVDTGVNVEVYPCVLAMTMALCGGALLLAKKKESER